jgi:hypothetical protein
MGEKSYGVAVIMPELFFNELSLLAKYADKASAQAGMCNFINSIKILNKLGYEEGIKTAPDFRISELSSGYSIENWCHDKNVDSDIKGYFLTKCSKTPYIDEYYIQQYIPDNVEYYFSKMPVIGLALGQLLHSISISFDADNCFKEFIIVVIRNTLQDDSSITKEDFEVYNISNEETVKYNKFKIREFLLLNFNSGKELLNNADKIFHCLKFCDNAVKQIQNLYGTERYFDEIKRHFMILNDTMSECTGTFRPDTIQYADFESEPTMHSKKCQAQRTFKCPDGKSRIFWEHSKLKAANIRIHFISDPNTKNVLIGYVGEHLSTAG